MTYRLGGGRSIRLSYEGRAETRWKRGSTGWSPAGGFDATGSLPGVWSLAVGRLEEAIGEGAGRPVRRFAVRNVRR